MIGYFTESACLTSEDLSLIVDSIFSYEPSLAIRHSFFE